MPRRKKIEEPMEQIKRIKSPALVKGMKDLTAGESRYWQFVYDRFMSLAEDFGFAKIDTPILEKYELFSHTLGRNHSLIKKEAIVFQEKNEKVIMRPDYTPAVARAYVEHGVFNQTPPIKFCYHGSVFSQGDFYQSKFNELRQLGLEVYNVPSPAVDAELVVLMVQMFEDLGLAPHVRINSSGCLSCRTEYLKALSIYIKSKRTAVCASCRASATKDPMKFLQCANQKCQKNFEDAPQVVDYLCEKCHTHLFKFLEALDEVKVDYQLDGSLSHDAHYYNGTIYSIYHRSEDKTLDLVHLADGGRFNYLVEMLSGPETPAVGIKFIMEKVVAALKENKIEVPRYRAPHVYFAQLSEQAKREAMKFVAELRREDFRVMANFSKDSLRSQLEVAQKAGAKIILILGQREVVDGTILMRDVESGIQEVVNRKKVISEIKKRLQDSKK